ncbi:hypothetical protein [Polymorphospora sp. NPDC050346]|uniref:hypothetical protein n=1 Tax=Polymorphospora sp. NPDC050346 TaxID=3155780 RepID=UPI0033FBD575
MSGSVSQKARKLLVVRTKNRSNTQDGRSFIETARHAQIEGFVRYCAERPAGIFAVGQIGNAEGWATEARERSIVDVEQLLRGGHDPDALATTFELAVRKTKR